MKMKKVWAIIPARGGSKGIPRKNIKPLGGRPLIAWAIDVAREAGFFERILASTDDPEIAEIARGHGADVPFLRPAEIATDQAIAGDAVDHMLEAGAARYGAPPDAYAVLFPTYPFRTPELVRRTVEALDDHLTAGTVRRATCRPADWYAPQSGGGGFRPVCGFPEMVALERPTGHASAARFYACRAGSGRNPAESKRLTRELLASGEIRSAFSARVYVDDPLACLDLDAADDWATAEWLIRKEWMTHGGSLS